MHHHLAYNKENKTETDPRPRFKPTVKKPEQRHPADNFTTKITLLISSLRSDIRSGKILTCQQSLKKWHYSCYIVTLGFWQPLRKNETSLPKGKMDVVAIYMRPLST